LNLYLINFISKRRKAENMNTYNLYALISDRLIMHTTEISMSLYNTLYEVI
jgi:hypothetical protein